MNISYQKVNQKIKEVHTVRSFINVTCRYLIGVRINIKKNKSNV